MNTSEQRNGEKLPIELQVRQRDRKYDKPTWVRRWPTYFGTLWDMLLPNGFPPKDSGNERHETVHEYSHSRRSSRSFVSSREMKVVIVLREQYKKIE